jgi:hypothetical protein
MGAAFYAYSTFAKSRHRAPHGSFMLCAIFFGHSAVKPLGQLIPAADLPTASAIARQKSACRRVATVYRFLLTHDFGPLRFREIARFSPPKRTRRLYQGARIWGCQVGS